MYTICVLYLYNVSTVPSHYEYICIQPVFDNYTMCVQYLKNMNSTCIQYMYNLCTIPLSHANHNMNFCVQHLYFMNVIGISFLYDVCTIPLLYVCKCIESVPYTYTMCAQCLYKRNTIVFSLCSIIYDVSSIHVHYTTTYNICTLHIQCVLNTYTFI